jgi:hypothetical protein
LRHLPRGPGLLGLGLAVLGLGLALLADWLVLRQPPLVVWLLQGLGWGVFGGGAALLIQRGWLHSPAIALARCIQLTAILAAALVLSAQVGTPPASGPQLHVWPGFPVQLTGWVLPVGLGLLAAGLAACNWRRGLAPACGLALAALMLYPGAPWGGRRIIWRSYDALATRVIFPQAGVAQGPDSVIIDAQNHLVRTMLQPDPGPWHRLGRQGADALDLLSPPQTSSPLATAMQGEVRSVPVSFAPLPGDHLALQILALLVPLLGLLALGGAAWLLGGRCPSRCAAALGLSTLAWAVMCWPLLEALLLVTQSGAPVAAWPGAYLAQLRQDIELRQTGLVAALFLLAGAASPLAFLPPVLRPALRLPAVVRSWVYGS